MLFALLLSAGLYAGDVAGRDASANDVAEFLRVTGYVVKWQHRLNIAFPIALKLVTVREMDEFMPGACGGSVYWQDDMWPASGLMLILRSDQYPAEGTAGRCGTPNIFIDQEHTVVHELLHYIVRLQGEESKVDLLARNLVRVEELK
jgi:hypothetical protein